MKFIVVKGWRISVNAVLHYHVDYIGGEGKLIIRLRDGSDLRIPGVSLDQFDRLMMRATGATIYHMEGDQ